MCSFDYHSKNSTINDYGLIVRNRNSDSKRKIQKFCNYDLTTSGKCKYVFDSLDAVVQHRVMKSNKKIGAICTQGGTGEGYCPPPNSCSELDGGTVGAYDAVC